MGFGDNPERLTESNLKDIKSFLTLETYKSEKLFNKYENKVRSVEGAYPDFISKLSKIINDPTDKFHRFIVALLGNIKFNQCPHGSGVRRYH